MLRGVSLQLGKKVIFNHHPNVPSNLRALLIGSSGSGKSTLLLQMVIEPDFLDFNSLIIMTPTKDQPIFQFIKHGFENNLSKEVLSGILLSQANFGDASIPEICRRVAEAFPGSPSPRVSIKIINNMDEIPYVDDLPKDKKHLVIFDDIITLPNQSAVESYFVFGRHNNVNVIYLSQSYFDLGRIIRLNSNFLILFKLSQRNLTDVCNSAVSNFMDNKKKFNQLALNAWSKKYGYIVIDKDRNEILTDVFSDPKNGEPESQTLT
jgi:energy-coupling factor transporter ATP-binding protein EcfA2